MMVTDVEDIIKRSQQGPQPPLTNVTKPYPNDVLCGRGGGSQNHIGNKEYRSVIAMSKRRYIEASRRHKSLLVESIVKAVRLQNPPGRFLEKDSKTGLWNDIGDKRAFAKTCQAIREGAPKIREEMQREQGTAGAINAAIMEPNRATSAMQLPNVAIATTPNMKKHGYNVSVNAVVTDGTTIANRRTHPGEMTIAFTSPMPSSGTPSVANVAVPAQVTSSSTWKTPVVNWVADMFSKGGNNNKAADEKQHNVVTPLSLSAHSELLEDRQLDEVEIMNAPIVDFDSVAMSIANANSLDMCMHGGVQSLDMAMHGGGSIIGGGGCYSHDMMMDSLNIDSSNNFVTDDVEMDMNAVIDGEKEGEMRDFLSTIIDGPRNSSSAEGWKRRKIQEEPSIFIDAVSID